MKSNNKGEFIYINNFLKKIPEFNTEVIVGLGHSVAVNATLSAYSILDISRLVEFFIDLKTKSNSPCELWFGTCYWPRHLQPNVLTGEYAIRARQELEKSIQLIKTISNNPSRSLTELENILKMLNTPAEDEFNKFARYTKDLDLIRNQSFNKTFIKK